MTNTAIRRVLRGGSWFSHPENLSPRFGRGRSAGYRSPSIGFRLVYREPPTDDQRALRGGSWSSGPESLRSAYRSWNNADYRSRNIGFRLIYRESPHD